MTDAEKAREFEIEESPSEPIIYSNLIIIHASPEEFILHLGVRKLSDPSVAKGTGQVVISPSHARRVLEALDRQIKEYEKIFGEIPRDKIEKFTEE